MNNFDQSSSGVNLELLCFFDNDLAQMEYDSNLARIGNYSLLNPRYRNVPLLQYTDHGCIGEIMPHDSNNYMFSKDDLKSAVIEVVSVSCMYEPLDQVLNDECNRVVDKPFSKCNKADLIQVLEALLYSSDEIAQFYYNHFTPKFTVISVRGYSQGDYCEVIIPAGVDVDPDYLQNLIYSSPLYCRLDVDGDEHYLDDIGNRYDYDKDAILERAKELIEHEKKAYILEWLADNLPVHPDYN